MELTPKKKTLKVSSSIFEIFQQMSDPSFIKILRYFCFG